MKDNINNIKHLAVTLDGNGRWASSRFLPKVEGHRAGAEAVRELIENVIELGIPNLTLYAMSAENLKRPQQEVSDIMGLMSHFLSRELKSLHENNVKIKILGDISKFNANLRVDLYEAEEKTKNNTSLTLRPALGYGSQSEITSACISIIRKGISAEDITEDIVANHLYDPSMPDVDLFIRPGGHMRMSNFLLWQSAYAELYFTKVLWPDFTKNDLLEAIGYFNSCKRNFGYSRDQKHDT